VSVDTDDGRCSKRGYSRTSVGKVDVFVSNRLGLYAERAEVDVRRHLSGKRLVIDSEHQPELECPE